MHFSAHCAKDSYISRERLSFRFRFEEFESKGSMVMAAKRKRSQSVEGRRERGARRGSANKDYGERGRMVVAKKRTEEEARRAHHLAILAEKPAEERDLEELVFGNVEESKSLLRRLKGPSAQVLAGASAVPFSKTSWDWYYSRLTGSCAFRTSVSGMSRELQCVFSESCNFLLWCYSVTMKMLSCFMCSALITDDV